MHWYERLTTKRLLRRIFADAFKPYEGPDLIAFGSATAAHLKQEIPVALIDFNRHSFCGIKYEIENDIPFGEFRYKKWVIEGRARKLRVYKTVRSHKNQVAGISAEIWPLGKKDRGRSEEKINEAKTKSTPNG